MSTEIVVNNDIININVTEETVIVEAPAGAYPLPYGVSSVYGRTGNIVAQEGDYNLTLLGDVTISSPATGQVLRFNGTTWVNSTESYIGTVTSVAASVPTGLTISGSPITTAGTLTFGLDTGYVIPLQSTLDAKALKAITISTIAPLTGGGDLSANRTFAIAKSTTSIDGYLAATDFTTFNNKQNALSGSGIVKSTSGVITYLTDNTATWDTAYNRSLTSASVTGTTTKTLTLNQQSGGTITASWSDLNAVTSVFGRTGAVVATSGDYTTTQVTEETNLYYTDVRARASNSFVAGSGAYNSTTGVITIPTNNNQITNGSGYITSSALSSYVPYTGATTNVNLGANNIYANAFFNGFSSITASGIQVVLTVLSAPEILVNGSGGQVIKLPDATTLPNGVIYSFNNNQSSGAISVNNNSNTLIVSIPSGGYAEVILLDNSIAAGTWDRHFQAPSNVSWSTNTLDYAGSITSATWNGTTIAINRGGTGATTAGAALTNLGGIGLTSLSATVPLSYNNTTGAFSISQATTSTNGYLTSTDWNTFNGKQSALTNPVTGTGTSGQVAYFNGTNSITSNAAFSFTPTSQLLVNNSVTASGAIARGTNLTPTLVAAANSDVLVGLDINPTFTNGGYASITNFALRVSGTTKFNGNINSEAIIYAASDNSYLSSTNSSMGFVKKFGTYESIAIGSSSLFRIQTSSATTISNVSSNTYSTVFSVDASGNSTANTFNTANGGNQNSFVIYNGGTSSTLDALGSISGSSPIGGIFLTSRRSIFFAIQRDFSTISSSTSALTIFQSSNVSLGQATDAGYRLDVNGTARVSGVLTLSSTITNGTYTYTLPGATGTLALTSQLNSGTVTSVAALTLGTTGTDLSSSVANSTTTPVITLNVPTASATNRGALSSTDWTTFNNKQNALTNPVTGTGTTNTLPKFTGSTSIDNSNITDSGSLITLGSNTTISSGGLGIGTTSLTGYSINVAKNITGATTSYGIRSQGTVQSDVTTLVSNYGSLLNTAAASFTLTNFVHHRSMQGTIGAGSVVINQYGYYADSTMIGATNNYGFYGNIPAGTNRWNIYMSGTAANYMAGQVAIGTTTLVATAALNVSSTTQGFLPPVMTTTQKNAISSPATGLVVFDSTLGNLCVFSTTWQTITSV